MSTAATTAIPDRRFDMDWLRIGAFALLILYHCGMFYVSWDWHVKSSRASEAIEPLMYLVNPWRLTLLMLISGAASRYMIDKMSAGGFFLARMGRLWPPLLLAFFVIVPPQCYFEVVEALKEANGLPAGAPAWLDNFYIKYVTGSGHWCDADGCLTTPTYNHMWFVAYLIIYTALLVPLLPLLRRIPRGVSVLLSGPLFILLPWAFLWTLRVTLFPIFGEEHDFRTDWYLHPLYLAVFLFGFAVAKHQAFFERCVRLRWFGLITALVCWASLMTFYAAYPGDAVPPDWQRMIFRGVHEMQAWTAIIAAIGFAHRYLANADGPIRRTLTVAIFPFYLIHQTIIVVAGHYLDPLQLPLWIEAPLLVGTTALGCWLFFDLARRVPPLRVWVGLPSRLPDFDGKKGKLALKETSASTI